MAEVPNETSSPRPKKGLTGMLSGLWSSHKHHHEIDNRRDSVKTFAEREDLSSQLPVDTAAIAARARELSRSSSDLFQLVDLPFEESTKPFGFRGVSPLRPTPDSQSQSHSSDSPFPAAPPHPAPPVNEPSLDLDPPPSVLRPSMSVDPPSELSSDASFDAHPPRSSRSKLLTFSDSIDFVSTNPNSSPHAPKDNNSTQHSVDDHQRHVMQTFHSNSSTNSSFEDIGIPQPHVEKSLRSTIFTSIKHFEPFDTPQAEKEPQVPASLFLKWYPLFYRINQSASGAVSAKELARGTGLTVEDAEKAIAGLGTENPGCLNFAEFVSLVPKAQKSGSQVPVSEKEMRYNSGQIHLRNARILFELIDPLSCTKNFVIAAQDISDSLCISPSLKDTLLLNLSDEETLEFHEFSEIIHSFGCFNSDSRKNKDAKRQQGQRFTQEAEKLRQYYSEFQTENVGVFASGQLQLALAKQGYILSDSDLTTMLREHNIKDSKKQIAESSVLEILHELQTKQTSAINQSTLQSTFNVLDKYDEGFVPMTTLSNMLMTLMSETQLQIEDIELLVQLRTRMSEEFPESPKLTFAEFAELFADHPNTLLSKRALVQPTEDPQHHMLLKANSTHHLDQDHSFRDVDHVYQFRMVMLFDFMDERGKGKLAVSSMPVRVAQLILDARIAPSHRALMFHMGAALSRNSQGQEIDYATFVEIVTHEPAVDFNTLTDILAQDAVQIAMKNAIHKSHLEHSLVPIQQPETPRPMERPQRRVPRTEAAPSNPPNPSSPPNPPNLSKPVVYSSSSFSLAPTRAGLTQRAPLGRAKTDVRVPRTAPINMTASNLTTTSSVEESQARSAFANRAKSASSAEQIVMSNARVQQHLALMKRKLCRPDPQADAASLPIST